MGSRCLLCQDAVAKDELLQHVTGDYHTACFASVGFAGLYVEVSDERALCLFCDAAIKPYEAVVKPADVAVHLACFFGPPRNGRKSLGAAASVLTLSETSVLLRCYSRALRRIAGRARDRAAIIRQRYAVPA